MHICLAAPALRWKNLKPTSVKVSEKTQEREKSQQRAILTGYTLMPCVNKGLGLDFSNSCSNRVSMNFNDECIRVECSEIPDQLDYWP